MKIIFYASPQKRQILDSAQKLRDSCFTVTVIANKGNRTTRTREMPLCGLNTQFNFVLRELRKLRFELH